MSRFHRMADGEVRRCVNGCVTCDGSQASAHARSVSWSLLFIIRFMGADTRRVSPLVASRKVVEPDAPCVYKITRLASDHAASLKLSEMVWGRRWSRQKRSLPVLVELPGGRVHSLHQSPSALVPTRYKTTMRSMVRAYEPDGDD